MVSSDRLRGHSAHVAAQQYLPEYAALFACRRIKLTLQLVSMCSPVLKSADPSRIRTDHQILNTLSDSSQCTVLFQAISAIMGIIVSLPRTLNHISTMSVVSAICMAIAIILSLVYAGIEANPLYGYGG
jgi:hypothetical protein